MKTRIENDREILIMKFTSLILLGLHETVEIESISKGRRIFVNNVMVTVMDNDNSGIATHYWLLRDLRRFLP